jgi:hypothetical protein
LNSIAKTRVKLVFSSFVYIAAIAMFTLSCNSSTQNRELEYYYYPQKNVYYNTQTNRFYYSLNGAKSWDSTQNNTDGLPGTLGDRIVINSANSRIFEENEIHRRKYVGSLFDFSQTGAIASTALAATERKTGVRKTAAIKKEQEKPKKGIGKFFSKLFGKDKKK